MANIFESAKTSRPKSAVSFRYSQHRNTRLNSNQSLNTIHSQIHKTFQNQNKLFKSIKQLTNSKGNSHYQNRINRLCVQFSICKKPSMQKSISDKVDVEFIAKRFLKSKSKQKQKQQEREILRRSVGAVSRRYIRQEPEAFFKFDREALKSMQQKDKNKGNKRQTKDHPYLLLYDKLQAEVVDNLNSHKGFGLGDAASYPALQEPDEWERQQKHIRQISGLLRNIRAENVKRRQRNIYGQNLDSFYIT